MFTGTIKKNALEAHRIYTQVNSAESKAAIADLRRWLETETHKGNRQAAEWLAKIQN